MTKLQKICEKYQYISFDIFDTLVKRITRNPKDIFDIVQDKYIKTYADDQKIETYTSIRRQAERIARSRKQSEINLDEIYDVVAEISDEEIADRYKLLEIETEIICCIPYSEMKKVYEYCIASEKKVFITSDMYLPKNVIEKILSECGYSGYQKLYLSCVSGNTKIVGNLYDELLKKEGIRPGELLHIGDNVKSDIVRAREKGVHTFHVKKYETDYKYKLDKDIKGYVLYKFVKSCNPYKDTFSEVGYGCFGPLLYGFISWIKQQAIINGHKKLYFLSRDGYIMRKVYEAIKRENDPKSYYFYASRRALQVAAIHFNPDYEYVMRHMFIPRYVSLRWLIRRWGLNPEEYQDKYDIETEYPGNSILGNNELKGIYDELKSEIIDNSITEYNAFCAYLEQMDFSGNVAIVDIGWYGNMQNSIMEMIANINRNVHISGYYLGIVPESNYQDQYDMHGYLFQKNKNEDLYPRFKYMASMLELFFMAPHGSAKRYTKNKNEVKVELSEFEYSGTKTYENMQSLQRAALEFVNDFKQRELLNLPENIYLALLFERFTDPDYETACLFGDLQMWDDKWMTLAPSYSVHKWIINPKEAIRRFINVSWKMGYLRRNVKLPLPYDKIVYKSRELYKK